VKYKTFLTESDVTADNQ